jgi:hypothetical protein
MKNITNPLPVFSLLCHRDIEMALICLGSFARHCKDSFQLTVLSDGSLTTEDMKRLREIDGLKVAPREEVEGPVLDALARHPHCAAFRKIHPWALKLIDAPLLAGGDFAYLDTDILFLRAFRGLDRRGLDEIDLAYMRSYANVYSFSLWERIRRERNLKLVERCNAGLLFARETAYRLDDIEEFLGRISRHTRPLLAEQTAWAMLAARVNSGHFADDQVVFPAYWLGCRSAAWRRAVVAVHFLGGSRHNLPRFVEEHSKPAVEVTEPALLRVTASRRLGLVAQAYDVAHHRLLLRSWRGKGYCR